jgi:hypothetical protein
MSDENAEGNSATQISVSPNGKYIFYKEDAYKSYDSQKLAQDEEKRRKVVEDNMNNDGSSKYFYYEGPRQDGVIFEIVL